MTYLEYRAKLAALVDAHRAAVAALAAEYNNQDREAIKTARAAHARLAKGAREWLAVWEKIPETMRLVSCTPLELEQARRACELDNRYQFHDGPPMRVTKRVTL